MKVYERMTAHLVQDTPCVVTFGNFDGMHKGHQALFENLKQIARANHLKTCVLTFSNHPLEVLRPHGTLPRLTVKEQKIELLKSFGIDIVLIIPFTDTIANSTPEDFILQLITMLPIHTMVVGHDVAFGANRCGNEKTLTMLAKKMGFSVKFMDTVVEDHERVSSTWIRSLLKKNDLSGVAHLLGRRYSLFGLIVKGIGAAKEMNCPTLNMHLENLACPPEGIYAVKVRFDKDSDWHPACAYIGRAKTLHKRKNPMLEVHLLDFIPQKKEYMEVCFYSFLRPDIVFDSKEELLKQIEKDIVDAKRILLDEKRN